MTPKKLAHPMPVRNADGSKNRDGPITEYLPVCFEMGKYCMTADFYITNIGNEDAILGMTWLKEYNPNIDWVSHTLHVPSLEPLAPRARKISTDWVLQHDIEHWVRTMEEGTPVDDLDTAIRNGNDVVWVRAKFTPAQQAAEKSHAGPAKTFEELVPSDLLGFRFVFEKEASERLPVRKPWDHAIDLKPGAEPRNCKVYPLTPAEQDELDKFLKEQLTKGYIRPSISPMASPFFFVKKKEGTLRPVQDYRYLNSITI